MSEDKLNREIWCNKKLLDTSEELHKKQEIIDKVKEAMRLYSKGDRKEGITLDSVMQAIGWDR